MSNTANVLCKGVAVHSGGYNVTNERGKVVEGNKKCVTFTFAPSEPPKEGEEKDGLLIGPIEVVLFGAGVESTYEVGKTYGLSIVEVE